MDFPPEVFAHHYVKIDYDIWDHGLSLYQRAYAKCTCGWVFKGGTYSSGYPASTVSYETREAARLHEEHYRELLYLLKLTLLENAEQGQLQ